MGIDRKIFDTNLFFAGGAGMFIQYHDVVKPVYLYAIIKMMLTDYTFGLPFSIVKDMSILSIIEWYIRRRYRNPLRSLDYNHSIDPNTLDEILQKVLVEDPSIYKLSPTLNIERMVGVYRKNMMMFPVYVYSEQEEPYIKEDCHSSFMGVDFKYVYGDLKSCIMKCDQNFTYIFSDIELANKAADILLGTYSHILVASDYRYNMIDGKDQMKYDLRTMMHEHPYVRTGSTTVCDPTQLAMFLSTLIKKGDK